MAKMRDRNSQLKSALGAMAPVERIIEAKNVPVEDTVNKQGYKAYSVDDELRLIAMLNTIKLEPQFYRSENDTMRELRDLIERIGLKDPYFVCQAIKYSRCMRDGMRSINHLAAALVSPFISGKDYAKRFYGPYNKKTQEGGCIFRPDDMTEIKEVYNALNEGTLSNAMKKGFAKAIEALDTYQLGKYRTSVIDISNLVHPKSALSKAVITVNGEKMKALDAIMKGITVSADTWEVANSEAGQMVAKAVKEGKLDKEEAKAVLAKAKNDNWEALLKEKKLGILAALRNIRNMMTDPRPEVINSLCELLSNPEAIKNGMIQPYQMDIAYEIINDEFYGSPYRKQVQEALIKGFELAIPNLKKALPGKTLVMVDCSGSMTWQCYNGRSRMRSSAADKAGLLAAAIVKATDADVIQFGTSASYMSCDKSLDVFKLGKKISTAHMGGTSIAAAFECARRAKKKYDRIILLSDNEANLGCTRRAYQNYIHDVCSPYIYAVDLAAYGTTPLKNNDKVNYYFGYGYKLFDDIASSEFNPNMHIDAVRKVVI
jgi:polyhydroxyalkanoate synthesis regulator phasin